MGEAQILFLRVINRLPLQGVELSFATANYHLNNHPSDRSNPKFLTKTSQKSCENLLSCKWQISEARSRLQVEYCGNVSFLSLPEGSQIQLRHFLILFGLCSSPISEPEYETREEAEGTC